ncbi:uncharacterized protein [Oscarella lobularis]|uniref:uncharacterized protein isoform X2 n=1 Tax=Oscarella lobularis TaxID=121494 RepID=UPI003313F6EF
MEFFGSFAIGFVSAASFEVFRRAMGFKKGSIDSTDQRLPSEEILALATCSNHTLRRSAVKMLLEKGTEDTVLETILRNCASSDEEVKATAMRVLSLLIRKGERKIKLIQRNSVSTLCNFLCTNSDEFQWNDVVACREAKRSASSALISLLITNGDAVALTCVNHPGMLRFLQTTLASSLDRELMKWLILIADSLCSSVVLGNLVSTRLPFALATASVFALGDPSLVRFCYRSLTELISYSEENEQFVGRQIVEVKDFIPACIGSLKSDEVASLSVTILGLLSERDLGISDIAAVPTVVRSLQCLLVSPSNGSNVVLKRDVYQTLFVMAYKSPEFSRRVLACRPLLRHVVSSIQSEDEALCQWSFSLVHHLASKGEDAVAVLLSVDDIITSVSTLASSNDSAVAGVAAETIGCLCSNEKVLDSDYQVIKALLRFVSLDNEELQSWAISQLHCLLSMGGDKTVKETVRAGVLRYLLDSTFKDMEKEQVGKAAAKVLVTMGFTDESFSFCLHSADGRANVTIDGKEECIDGNGLNVVVLDSTSFCVVKRRNFSTGTQTSESDDFTVFLRSLPNGTVILIVSKGDSVSFLTDDALRELQQLTFNKFDTLGNKCSFVALIIKGRHCQMKVGEMEPVSLNYKLEIGSLVNEMVQCQIVDQIVGELLSGASRITAKFCSDLALLDIFVRSRFHRQYLANRKDFVLMLQKLVRIEDTAIDVSQVTVCFYVSSVLHSLSEDENFCHHFVSCKLLNALISSVFNLLQIRLRHRVEMGSGSSGGTGCSLAVSSALDGSVALLDRIPSRQRDSAPCVITSIRDRFDVASASSSRDATPSGTAPIAVKSLSMKPSHSVGEIEEDGEGVDDDALSSDGSSVIEELERTSAESRASQSLIDYYHEAHDNIEFLTSNLIRYFVLSLANCIHLTKQSPDSVSGAAAYHCLWYLLMAARPGAYPPSLWISVERALCEMSLIEAKEENVDWVELKSDRKDIITIASDRMKVRNESWTFETVIANRSVGFSSDVTGWYYEATLNTSGIMQIGWASPKATFRPEKGIGVGNCNFSHAFDGGRGQAWNSQPKVHLGGKDYGKRWQEGDVLSCLLDSTGTVSFWLNGENLGEAFQGIDTDDVWHPALSLCTEQQCSLNFGYEPLRYEPPEGFKSVSAAAVYDDVVVEGEIESTATGNYIIEISEDAFASDGSIFTAPSSIDYFYEIVIVHTGPKKQIWIGFRESFGQQVLFSLPSNVLARGTVIGCGLALSPPSIFLTVNGNVKGMQHHNVSFSSTSPSVFPTFSIPRVSLNLGQYPFDYEKANREAARTKTLQNLLVTGKMRDSAINAD